MGAWGTSISSNDTYADIYSDFYELYNEGFEVAKISQKLIAANKKTIKDVDDCNNFWFALARAQWECKQLDNNVFERVKKVIETGGDLEVWRQLDADDRDLKKRKVALDKFLAELQTEKPKAKARKKVIIRQPVFEKGDCLTFRFENGNYGGAVVLEAIRGSAHPYNLIATTRINQSIKPAKNDFQNAELLITNFANLGYKPVVQWYNTARHKKKAHLVEKIDTIEVQIDYDINKSTFGFVGDFEIWVIQIADRQLNSEETKPGSNVKQTVKELTKKNKWKIW
ncbi:hypothetical protein ACFP1I_19865 [Dyadobacter subterraneus]|uniref:DUF4259 domain-containing protein n=1 Tax=Dyadobacter subterraneus TaxID=2773304 RepID=A0ABR9W7G0_9BACT|nr:hypothetical protein [Dyadobacter subterraneus]MBE9460891.1 hypothetical protein [Dyadobacter subterraneus]